jgi:2,4-dienoyl-CoA reductase-like NADH-dependent reductase (Old Yellow Enzyme family)
MPRALSRRMIVEIVQGYGEAARRLQEAELDGVEIVGSHRYLPAQLVNSRVNLGKDNYGGSLGYCLTP